MSANIVLVDDAAFMRMMIKGILVKNGFKVIGEAEDGQQAVEMYRELKPDLLIMDITMPKMTGLEALKIIKTESPQAKIIMCSAMGQEWYIIEAVKSGADDFIIKPFQEDRVLEGVRKTLGIV